MPYGRRKYRRKSYRRKRRTGRRSIRRSRRPDRWGRTNGRGYGVVGGYSGRRKGVKAVCLAPELKLLDVNDTGTIVLSGAAVNVQVDIRQGLTSTTRVGDHVRVMSVESVFTLYNANPFVANVTVETFPHIHFLEVIDTDVRGVLCPLFGAFNTESIYVSPVSYGAYDHPFRQPSTAGRIKILSHKIIKPRPIKAGNTDPGGGAPQVDTFYFQQVLVKIYRKWRKGLPVHYIADTGAITDLDRSGYMVYMWINSSGAGGTKTWAYDVYTRQRYCDS